MDRANLDARDQKWLEQGRGTGVGKDYRPWLTVRDVPSAGRSSRILGSKTQRTHHLLSDLELGVFYLLDWHQTVIDIREQFPLQIDETLEIATNAGIKHPAVRGAPQVMSSDFLINTSDPNQPSFAIQVKSTADLSKPRVIEKLEIERRYWAQKEIPWYLWTEDQIPKAVIKNISWLYPAQEELHGLLDTVPMFADHFAKYPQNRISKAAQQIDKAYSLELGESLGQLRALLAMRVFTFDIQTPWSNVEVGELKITTDLQLLEDQYATHQ